MISLTVAALLGSPLPVEYYEVTHCLYIVRNGFTVLYVGKAVRQSTHERLLQHLAAEIGNDYYGWISGPSELGKYILANAPESKQWQIDLLALEDCQSFSKSNSRRVTVSQAEKLLIQKHSPLLNQTHNSKQPALPIESIRVGQASDATGKVDKSKEQSFSPPRILPAYALQYLTSASENKKTQDTYRYALLRFQEFAVDQELTAPFTPLQPGQLHKEILVRFLDWLKQAGLKNNSMRTFLAVVKQYLLWLQAENRLPDGLRAEEIQRSLERKAGPHLRSIPPEHRQADESVGRLLSYYSELLKERVADTPRHRRQKLARLRNQAILQTLYSTAGRASEVASLTREQVIKSLAGEERSQQLLPVEICGVGDKRRLIYLVPEAQKAIRAYLKARSEIPTGASGSHGLKGDGDPLFVRHDRDYFAPISTKTVWLIVNEAAKEMFGCDANGRPLKRVGPNQFRHLRAQHLHDDGMRLDTLQAILGHSSPVITRRTYAERTSPERLTSELEQYGRDPNEVAKGA